MLFKTLLTLHLGLVDSVVHTIDLGLLFLDDPLELDDLLLEPVNRLVKLIYFCVQLCLFAFEFLFLILTLFLELLQHLRVIRLFLGDLLLMLAVELLDFL